MTESLDPITVEVVRYKLDGIANEMQSTLLRSSFSPIVKEGLDASASLFTPDGTTLSQSCSIPIHLATLIPAVAKVLAQAGMSLDDMDVVELNEAFAAQVVPCMREWGIDPEKLNPFGGAIALGHPFGMTGARIMTTLLNGLETLDGTYGLETMCVAGGMGQAMIVERL